MSLNTEFFKYLVKIPKEDRISSKLLVDNFLKERFNEQELQELKGMQELEELEEYAEGVYLSIFYIEDEEAEGLKEILEEKENLENQRSNTRRYYN
jgi:hypothetical protein